MVAYALSLQLLVFGLPMFCWSGFELSIFWLQNAIYFSIIVTCEFHLYCWDHVCKVNEWCLVDCFHCNFRVSIQIMVCYYCITKCKKFLACGKLSILLQTVFLVIQNICINLNPVGYICIHYFFCIHPQPIGLNHKNNNHIKKNRYC